MELTQIYKKHNSSELQEFFNRCPWQMWFSGSAEETTSLDQLDSIFAKFRTIIAEDSHLQVGCMGVLSASPQPHVHALLVGQSKEGRSFEHTEQDTFVELVKIWKRLTHRSSVFERVRDDGAVKYTVLQNLLYNPTAQMLSPANVPLIQKLSSYKKGIIRPCNH